MVSGKRELMADAPLMSGKTDFRLLGSAPLVSGKTGIVLVANAPLVRGKGDFLSVEDAILVRGKDDFRSPASVSFGVRKAVGQETEGSRKRPRMAETEASGEHDQAMVITGKASLAAEFSSEVLPGYESGVAGKATIAGGSPSVSEVAGTSAILSKGDFLWLASAPLVTGKAGIATALVGRAQSVTRRC
jgi:hypothetical protein